MVQLNAQPDDENLCDTYVPRGNREAVKLHGDIFEKFNEKNQLSKRGAWDPQHNQSSTKCQQFEQLIGNIDISNIDRSSEDKESVNDGQPSRNKPLEGLCNLKKHQSLKLTSQKPKNKFNPNK